MTSQQDVTTGELFRALGKVEKAVDDGFKAVNERIDNLRHEYVSKEVFDLQVATLEGRIDGSVTSRRYWVTTCLASIAVIVAFVAPLLR